MYIKWKICEYPFPSPPLLDAVREIWKLLLSTIYSLVTLCQPNPIHAIKILLNPLFHTKDILPRHVHFTNIFLPSPLLDTYFSPEEIYYIDYLSLFCNFVNFKSIGGKKCTLLTNWGEKYAFSPLFFHPFSFIFFSQHDIWPYFCPLAPWGSQTEKYTPLV